MLGTWGSWQIWQELAGSWILGAFGLPNLAQVIMRRALQLFEGCQGSLQGLIPTSCCPIWVMKRIQKWMLFLICLGYWLSWNTSVGTSILRRTCRLPQIGICHVRSLLFGHHGEIVWRITAQFAVDWFVIWPSDLRLTSRVQGLEDGKGLCHSLELSLEGNICRGFGRVALGLYHIVPVDREVFKAVFACFCLWETPVEWCVGASCVSANSCWPFWGYYPPLRFPWMGRENSWTLSLWVWSVSSMCLCQSQPRISTVHFHGTSAKQLPLGSGAKPWVWVEFFWAVALLVRPCEFFRGPGKMPDRLGELCRSIYFCSLIKIRGATFKTSLQETYFYKCESPGGQCPFWRTEWMCWGETGYISATWCEAEPSN